jgi:predicted dehydrogenase
LASTRGSHVSAARTPTVSLIGCGGVGSRHLQALLKLRRPLRIQVAEPRSHAADIGRARAEEIGVPADVRLEWYESLEQLSSANVTIVATLAGGRVRLISRLLERGDRRFLIEKVACQSSEEFSQLLGALEASNAKGWVNCPRRYYTFYERLRQDLRADAPVVMKVSAGDRGLGCNAIHYLDIFHYLTGRLPASLSGAFLSPEVKANRRGADLVEFSGSLSGRTSADDCIDITFAPAAFNGALVTISSPCVDAFADEARYFAAQSSRSDGGSWREGEYGHQNVSDVTTMIIRDILETDDCRLATAAQSSLMHSLLFDVFNDHLERVTGTRPSLCPIT